VHEDIVAALALDESVPLGVIEPLDLAGDAHTTCLPYETRGAEHRARSPIVYSASTAG
jgi:hypothetical protein